MRKTINKIFTGIIGLVASICMTLGFVCMEKQQPTFAHAEMVASTKWSNTTTNANLTAQEDTETGYTHLSGMNAWGDRLYYNEKLTLDGLTVVMGSAHSAAGPRFGFGFTNNAGGYTPESGPLNVTCVAYQWDGQNRLYVNNNHADGTICYRDSALTNSTNPFGITTSFVAMGTGDDAYSFTFALVVDKDGTDADVWSVTIDIVKGTMFNGQATPCTVYFSGAQISGILDSDGKCYLSAWGMENTDKFYIGITTAEEKALIAAVDSALTAYETARTAGGTMAAERATAVEAVENLPARYKASYQAKLDAIDAIDSSWVAAWGGCEPATYNAATGYSTMTPNAYGERMYYNKKVTLDGLKVTIGAKNADMVAGSRFGFGFLSTATAYSPAADAGGGVFNVTAVPSEDSGQNRVYFNSTHASGNANCIGGDLPNLVYTADTFTPGVYAVDGTVVPCFVSATADTGDTVYSIAFQYMGQFNTTLGDYWHATITLEEGAPFGSAASSATVAFLESSLNGILDNGQVYISAFGMSNGAFYMGVEEAEDSATLDAAESAVQAYEEAVRSNVDVETKKAEALAAIESLGGNAYVGYANQIEKVQEMETSVSELSQSMGLTVTDGLTLSYKVDVPEAFGEVDSVKLVVNYRDEQLVYEDINVDDLGRYVFQMNKLTPQYMSEEFSFTFEALDGSDDLCVRRTTETYSVKAYCESLIESNSDAYLRRAVVDMLNYGAAAQTYVNNSNEAANAGVSDYQKYATSVDPATATNVLAVNQSSGVVTFTAATLLLEDNISVAARFKTKEAYGLARLTATAQVGDGEPKSVEVFDGGNGTYFVLCGGILPTQYDENVIFRVSVDGTEYASCRYSVNSYVARNHSNASSGDLVKALYAYGVGMDAYAKITENVTTATSGNLLKDTLFGNGVQCFGTTAANAANDYTNYQTFIEGATPSWQICQWDSRFDMQDVANPTFSNGVYTFTDNNSKTLQLNSNTGSIYMEILGEKEYPTQDRQNSTELWPHLLLQQEWFGNDLVQLSSLSSMNMKMTYTVTKFENKMHGKADAGLHRAQFVWYITLQNRTEGHADFGEYMWFGLMLYDNTEAGTAYNTYYRGDDDTANNTGMLMCLSGSSNWSSTGKIAKVGETISVNYNILTAAQDAFNYAKKKGWFANSTWEDIYIGSTNFGFEIPGTYNIGVQIDEAALNYTKA